MGYTYNQLNNQWKSVFDTAEGTALTLTGFLGHGFALAASYSIRKFRVSKVRFSSLMFDKHYFKTTVYVN